jgi:hypothetical protein
MNDITLDPANVPEQGAPLAQGHTREDADEARAAMLDHKDAVQAEAEQPEVGARDVGDHAGEQTPDDSSDDSDVPQGSSDTVLAWVGDDRDRAARALEAERAGQQRSTLIAKLEAIAD